MRLQKYMMPVDKPGPQADAKWMLDVVATLTNGEHHFFKMDYVPPPRNAPREGPVPVPMLQDVDNIFNSIPVMPGADKVRRKTMFLTKAQKEQHKLAKQQRAKRMLERQLGSLTERITLQEAAIEHAIAAPRVGHV